VNNTTLRPRAVGVESRRARANTVTRSRVGITAAILVAAALVSLLAGCSRRAPERPHSEAPSDTLANGLPRALEPQLVAWVQVWRSAIPGFVADSLVREGSAPFRFDYAWAGAGRPTDDIRARARINVLSPDSTRSLDFDMYLDFDGDESGTIQLGREPDSAPILADFRSDTLWGVAVCGTPCGYDGAYWADSERLALTGYTESGPGAGGPWRGFLDIYDLRTRIKARWVTRLVDGPEYAQYAAAADAALIARLESAGFAGD
jgi:hypothetical protein